MTGWAHKGRSYAPTLLGLDPGVNTFEARPHETSCAPTPTVNAPLALVVDALKDCSKAVGGK